MTIAIATRIASALKAHDVTVLDTPVRDTVLVWAPTTGHVIILTVLEDGITWQSQMLDAVSPPMKLAEGLSIAKIAETAARWAADPAFGQLDVA